MAGETTIFKLLFAVSGTTIAFLFGGWDKALIVLAVLMSIDYLTGVVKAFVMKEINSATGARGLIKKGAMLLVIILANMVDFLLDEGYPIVRTAIVYYYISNEGVSIIENLSMLGVPMPDVLIESFAQLQNTDKKSDDDQKE